MLNKVFLIGNLTRDPEVKYIPSGTQVTEFDLAVNRRFKAKDGSRQEEVLFISISAWGRTGELVAEYLKKGRRCLVEGRLKLDKWQDKKDGSARSKITVVAENVRFLDTRGDATGGGDYSSGSSTARPARTEQENPDAYGGGDGASYHEPEMEAEAGATEDDLPF